MIILIVFILAWLSVGFLSYIFIALIDKDTRPVFIKDLIAPTICGGLCLFVAVIYSLVKISNYFCFKKLYRKFNDFLNIEILSK